MMHPRFGNNPEFSTFRVPLTVTSWMQPWSHPTPQSGLPLAVCCCCSRPPSLAAGHGEYRKKIHLP